MKSHQSEDIVNRMDDVRIEPGFFMTLLMLESDDNESTIRPTSWQLLLFPQLFLIHFLRPPFCEQPRS